MREFIVLGHTAPTDPEFSLDDLAGGAGRLDVLCRCVNAAFVLSHAVREDTRLHLVLRDSVTVTFAGRDLRNVAPDERNIAAHIRNALDAAADAVGHQPVESSPGISVAKRGFEPVLRDATADGVVLLLHEDGLPLPELGPPDSPTFVLSDHRHFTDEEAALLDGAADERVSVGPERLHADHAIVVAHNYLDTDGFSRY